MLKITADWQPLKLVWYGWSNIIARCLATQPPTPILAQWSKERDPELTSTGGLVSSSHGWCQHLFHNFQIHWCPRCSLEIKHRNQQYDFILFPATTIPITKMSMWETSLGPLKEDRVQGLVQPTRQRWFEVIALWRLWAPAAPVVAVDRTHKVVRVRMLQHVFYFLLRSVNNDIWRHFFQIVVGGCCCNPGCLNDHPSWLVVIAMVSFIKNMLSYPEFITKSYEIINHWTFSPHDFIICSLPTKTMGKHSRVGHRFVSGWDLHQSERDRAHVAQGLCRRTHPDILTLQLAFRGAFNSEMAKIEALTGVAIQEFPVEVWNQVARFHNWIDWSFFGSVMLCLAINIGGMYHHHESAKSRRDSAHLCTSRLTFILRTCSTFAFPVVEPFKARVSGWQWVTHFAAAWLAG